MPLRLLILDGPRAGEDIPLSPGRHVLGRSPNLAAIAIEDPMISRRHLELVVEGESCRVRDLGAANGTVVRGRLLPATEVPLEPGEELLLGGRVRVRLLHDPDTREEADVLDRTHPCAECGREISLETFAEGQVFENAGVFICPACVTKVRLEARQVVAGYELLDRIGEGGMGSVYKARQVSIGRLVALKTIRRDLARDEKVVRRFLREAQLAARLTHPNIVMLYDTGEAEGTYYIAMEYVEGQTLRRLVTDSHPLPARRVLDLGRQLASALAHAGSLGIVHRDVKPDNVLVTAEDQAKLTDFGL
ncbi:MAG: protein kinase [Planctomycetes bacterium]|nr:protein kinase [Planctomycetota bacterium]